MAEAAETVIEARGLDLTFQTSDGPVHALKDVNLTVERGDFVSFIGPSGCGKTTLLRGPMVTSSRRRDSIPGGRSRGTSGCRWRSWGIPGRTWRSV